MIDALFSQPTYVGAQKMLDAAVMRHEAIAANIANVETPHYKRVDVAGTFGAELKRAISGGDSARIAALQPKVETDATTTACGRDGNNVRLEDELLALNQNQLAHTLETQLISGTLLKLRLAITGRPS